MINKGLLMSLRDADEQYISEQNNIKDVFINSSYWWQNASFVLPLLLGSISYIFGQIFDNSGAKGFGIFLIIVMIVMLPVVWLTWRSTATSISFTDKEIIALHLGKVLKKITLDNLQSIETIEYLGQRRYKLVESDEIFFTIDNEFDDVSEIIKTITARTGMQP